MAEKKKKEVLYKDKYITLTHNYLRIRNYYASPGSKTIKLKNITYVKDVRGMGLRYTDYHYWGMGTTNIWWALGPRIKFSSCENALVKVKGDKIKKGFTVQHINEFFRALQGAQGLKDWKHD
mmetsp:Transcript_2596/g.2901  ORF Transcript_2596/g.2901 Transcript_2596/m.2901 type:complete len:122 (+) Transcript_2596:33-398(+)